MYQLTSTHTIQNYKWNFSCQPLHTTIRHITSLHNMRHIHNKHSTYHWHSKFQMMWMNTLILILWWLHWSPTYFNHIALNTCTPTWVPNITHQQASSRDITSLFSTIHNNTTQHNTKCSQRSLVIIYQVITNTSIDLHQQTCAIAHTLIIK